VVSARTKSACSINFGIKQLDWGTVRQRGNRIVTNQNKKKDYDVGYCKPPKEGQFQKGQSGNAKGRPEGSKSWKTLLEEVGRERITIIERGKPKRITKKKGIAKRAYHRALVEDDLSYLEALGAFKEVEVDTREFPLTFTLAVDEPPPAREDNDFDYSQPQTRPGGGSTDPE
jgi:hypothetical protein